MAQIFQITIGDGSTYDPGDGATLFTIPFLKGVNFYVERHGEGALPLSNYLPVNSGGFQLINGYITTSGETYTIHYINTTYQGTVGNGVVYSNSYNVSKVLSVLSNRIGWRQHAYVDVPSLDIDNTVSRSGRYFNDAHTLCNIKNIYQLTEYVEHTEGTFNEELRNLKKSVILSSLNGVLNANEFICDGNASSYYNLTDSYDTLSFKANESKFVGYSIIVKKGKALRLSELQLHFKASTPVNIYLFSSHSNVPIWNNTFTPVANQLYQIGLEDFVLTPVNDVVYFLGYFQDQIGLNEAIYSSDSHTCGKIGCKINGIYNNANYSALTFDKTQHVEQSGVGINFTYSTFNDNTEKVVRGAHLFDELLMLQMAYKVIEMSQYNTRSNAEQRINREQSFDLSMQMEKDGVAIISDSPKTTGLKQKIEREIKRVKNEFYQVELISTFTSYDYT